MQLTDEIITPEIAADWLKCNTNNRVIRRNRVEQYAEAMRRGEWHLTGEAITWNGDRLLNGQHRLMACVLAGVSFRTVVVRDVPAESMTVMDSGLARTMGDVLRFHGASNVNSTAAAARLVLEWRSGVLKDPAKARRLVTRDDVAELALAHEEEWADANKRGQVTCRAIGLQGSVWIAMAFEAARIDSELSGSFFDRLADGASLAYTDPILALRNWCVNSVAQQRRRRKVEVLTVSAKCWNAWVAGRPMKMVKVLPGEDVPTLTGL